MVTDKGPGLVLMTILAAVLWVAYFAICSKPTGAPFIYADF